MCSQEVLSRSKVSVCSFSMQTANQRVPPTTVVGMVLVMTENEYQPGFDRVLVLVTNQYKPSVRHTKMGCAIGRAQLELLFARMPAIDKPCRNNVPPSNQKNCNRTSRYIQWMPDTSTWPLANLIDHMTISWSTNGPHRRFSVCLGPSLLVILSKFIWFETELQCPLFWVHQLALVDLIRCKEANSVPYLEINW